MGAIEIRQLAGCAPSPVEICGLATQAARQALHSASLLCIAEMDGIPVDDDRGQEVEASDPVMLSICRAIADFTLATDTKGIPEGMVGLALVEPDLGTPLHVRVEDPLYRECVRYVRPRAARPPDRFDASRKRACARVALGPIFPAVIVAARRKRSGQFATIRSSRILPPTSLRNSLGVASGLNTYSRFDGRSRMRRTNWYRNLPLPIHLKRDRAEH